MLIGFDFEYSKLVVADALIYFSAFSSKALMEAIYFSWI